MGFGLIFFNTSAGTLNTMMRYWEMRDEIKKLTKSFLLQNIGGMLLK